MSQACQQRIGGTAHLCGEAGHYCSLRCYKRDALGRKEGRTALAAFLAIGERVEVESTADNDRPTLRPADYGEVVERAFAETEEVRP